MTHLKPFEDIYQGPVVKCFGEWGWFNYPAIGEEQWQGDYPTRDKARLARKAQKSSLKGSGQMLEYKFWNS